MNALEWFKSEQGDAYWVRLGRHFVTTIDRRGNLAEPNACQFCCEPERGHGERWHNIVGWHTWIEPSNTTRLLRMKYRRGLTP